MSDDLYRLRIDRSNSRPIDRGTTSSASPAFVGKVTSTGTNLGAGKFARVTPQMLLGDEVEAGAGTKADQPGSQLVYILGPSAPATDDLLVCRFVDYRWVAERMTGGGSGGGICDGCPLTTDPISYFVDRGGGFSVSGTMTYGVLSGLGTVWHSPVFYLGVPAAFYTRLINVCKGSLSVQCYNDAAGTSPLGPPVSMACAATTYVQTCSPYSLTWSNTLCPVGAPTGFVSTLCLGIKGGSFNQ